MDAKTVMRLRKLKGLDQGEVAEQVGLTQSGYSRLERDEDRQVASGALVTKLSKVLALGDRGARERTPHFALAAEGADRGLDLIVVAKTHTSRFDHLGVFRDRKTAERVARLLRETGELPIYAVPVWLGYAATALAKRLGRTPAEGELFVVDKSGEPMLRVDAALAHGLAVRQAFAAEQSHGQAAAELAASLARPIKVKRAK